MNITWLLFSFKGRISRLPFWVFTLASMTIALIPAFFIYGVGTDQAENFVNISSLIFLWPALAVQAKRWHDRDKSAWWILINLVPLVGFIWALVENGFLRGTGATNRFGEAPYIVSVRET